MFYFFCGDRLHKIVTGSQLEGLWSILTVACGKHNVALRIDVFYISCQFNTCHISYRYIQKGDMDHALRQGSNGIGSIIKGHYLCLRQGFADTFGQLLQKNGLILYGKYPHYFPPHLGIIIVAVVPSPGVLEISRLPPTISLIRYRLFIIPICFLPSSKCIDTSNPIPSSETTIL